MYYFNIFETRSSWSVGAPVKSVEETSDIDIDGTRFPMLVLCGARNLTPFNEKKCPGLRPDVAK